MTTNSQLTSLLTLFIHQPSTTATLDATQVELSARVLARPPSGSDLSLLELASTLASVRRDADESMWVLAHLMHYDHGVSERDLAKMFGVHRNTLHKYISSDAIARKVEKVRAVLEYTASPSTQPNA